VELDRARGEVVAGTKPPELKISGVGKFKLIADESVQSYVTTVGQSLIPAHQRTLATDDPRRINFRFFVVDNKNINAFALPNGIVVVNAGMFGILENEAQFAAVVGHEIAHATQEHTWRQMQFHKKKRIGLQIAAVVAAAYGKYSLSDVFTLTLAAIQNGYSRSLENQADRVGLEYMVSAGYDARQAPQVWKSMTKATGLHSTDFFWSSHDNHATRRSYLMNELKINLCGCQLRHDEDGTRGVPSDSRSRSEQRRLEDQAQDDQRSAAAAGGCPALYTRLATRYCADERGATPHPAFGPTCGGELSRGPVLSVPGLSVWSARAGP
jgi:Peptidase family M48